jgi:hypothetical protein
MAGNLQLPYVKIPQLFLPSINNYAIRLNAFCDSGQSIFFAADGVFDAGKLIPLSLVAKLNGETARIAYDCRCRQRQQFHIFHGIITSAPYLVGAKKTVVG